MHFLNLLPVGNYLLKKFFNFFKVCFLPKFDQFDHCGHFEIFLLNILALFVSLAVLEQSEKLFTTMNE